MSPPDFDCKTVEREATVIGLSFEQAEAVKAALAFRACQDEAFHARLNADPAAALADLGGRVIEGPEIRVVYESPNIK